ncbi:formin-like protein 5 [Leopardus geoffroyi]|uniref:formin-like protein 5 n=1 Tax=Leopardus geoffroyi TaxID=46844 RepID=UPI001E265BF9|nr:formin-like protein 5 [Leopardus geoffroyi]
MCSDGRLFRRPDPLNRAGPRGHVGSLVAMECQASACCGSSQCTSPPTPASDPKLLWKLPVHLPPPPLPHIRSCCGSAQGSSHPHPCLRSEAAVEAPSAPPPPPLPQIRSCCGSAQCTSPPHPCLRSEAAVEAPSAPPPPTPASDPKLLWKRPVLLPPPQIRSCCRSSQCSSHPRPCLRSKAAVEVPSAPPPPTPASDPKLLWKRPVLLPPPPLPQIQSCCGSAQCTSPPHPCLRSKATVEAPSAPPPHLRSEAAVEAPSAPPPLPPASGLKLLWKLPVLFPPHPCLRSKAAVEAPSAPPTPTPASDPKLL